MSEMATDRQLLNKINRDVGVLIGKFEGVENRLEHGNLRMDEIETHLSDLNATLPVQTARIDNLEDNVSELKQLHVLGGTTKREKAGIIAAIAGTAYTLARIVAKIVGVDLP